MTTSLTIVAALIGIYFGIRFYGPGWLDRMSVIMRFVAKVLNQNHAVIVAGGRNLAFVTNNKGVVTFEKIDATYETPDEHWLGRKLLKIGYIYLGLGENRKLLPTFLGNQLPFTGVWEIIVGTDDPIDLSDGTPMTCKVAIRFTTTDREKALTALNTAGFKWVKEAVEQTTRDEWEKFNIFEILTEGKEDAVKTEAIKNIKAMDHHFRDIIGINIDEVKIPVWTPTISDEKKELLQGKSSAQARLEAEIAVIDNDIRKEKLKIGLEKARKKHEATRLEAEKAFWESLLASVGGDTTAAKETQLAKLLGPANFAELQRRYGMESFRMDPKVTGLGTYSVVMNMSHPQPGGSQQQPAMNGPEIIIEATGAQPPKKKGK